MAYSHTTWTALQTALSTRLGDGSQRFWTSTEIPLYLAESIRSFGLCSAFWRQRGVLATSTSQPFYDLTSVLSGSLLTSTVTDRDIIQQIQFYLCESASTQSSWPGTAQFTYNDVVNSLTRRRNQFLSDTGIILTRSTQAVASPPIGRQSLTDTIIDVRRASFQGASPLNYYTTLWRTDERELVLDSTSWNVNSGAPVAFSVMGPPPLQVQIVPPPVSSGTLDMLTVNTGQTLDPATSATALGVPDDVSPAVKWGALADLLGIDGQARDSSRAQYCETRYQQYVQLARLLACVVNAEIQGVSSIPTSLYDLDAGVADFQNYTGTPNYPALAGWNMLAISPVPDGVYSITLDVIKNAPVPSAGGDQVQIGREQLDMILDYAEHLALFKVGGYEFAATQRQADNFLLQSITYNQRLSATAKYIFAAKKDSQREKDMRPRRQQSDGLGAMPAVQEASSFVKARVPVRLKQQ